MRSAKDVDAQTDLWALGVILFELMTGRAPFVGDTVTEVAIKVAHEPAPAISGGALVASGAVLLFATGHAPPTSASSGLVLWPAVGPGGGSLSIRREF
jgi:serine/threonine protein kinase